MCWYLLFPILSSHLPYIYSMFHMTDLRKFTSTIFNNLSVYHWSSFSDTSFLLLLMFENVAIKQKIKKYKIRRMFICEWVSWTHNPDATFSTVALNFLVWRGDTNQPISWLFSMLAYFLCNNFPNIRQRYGTEPLMILQDLLPLQYLRGV
jgi:hypothetical protein